MQTFHLCSRADGMIVSHKAVTDLGVYLFLLQANFYSLSRQHRGGGDHHCKDRSLSKLQLFALSNSPGSVLLERFSSQLNSSFTPTPLQLLKGFQPVPHLGRLFYCKAYRGNWRGLLLARGLWWWGCALAPGLQALQVLPGSPEG